MRMFGFKAPQERLGPQFFRSEQAFENANTGRFVRNAVLDGMTYGSSDLAPAWLKTRDAVHPLLGYRDQIGRYSSVFGGYGASAAADKARAILNQQNASVWWAPGGNGVNAYIYAKLPETTLVETYLVGTNAASCPLSWKLQGSLEGETWNDLHIVENTGVWDASFEAKTFTVPEEGRGNYLYYRLLITASNAATMQLRNFRLFRAASVCGKGQLLLDASAENPLVLSFADGFNGIIPIDHNKSISAAQLTNMFDDSGCPVCRGAPVSSPIQVNIYAVHGGGGAVGIEIEDVSGEGGIQAEGGMASVSDKGWTCNVDKDFIFSRFGAKLAGREVRDTIICFMSQATNGVYISKAKLFNHSGYYPPYFHVIEMDNTETNLGLSGPNAVFNVNRRIKGVKLTPYSVAFYHGGILLYSPAVPEYRFSFGKLYSREYPDVSWRQCQKIKLGTAVLDPSGEVFQPFCLSSLDMQWMSNGNAETHLGA